MVEFFKLDKTFAFIDVQLNWIGLNTNYDNLIEDVIDKNDTNKLVQWLEEHKDERLFGEEQQELSNLIIKELTTIGNDIDYRTKKLKPMTIENILRVQLGLNYAISKPKKESKGDNRGKRYITISEIK